MTQSESEADCANMQTMKFFKEVGNIPLLLMATLIPPSLSAEEGRHVLEESHASKHSF